MFSKEFMNYLNEKEEKKVQTPASPDNSPVTRPLFYIILKYNTSPRRT